MKTIALVGDPSPDVRAHRAIPLALEKWESRHPGRLALRWFPTADLARDGTAALGTCAAVWCVPGSPYASMDAALDAIRFAREAGRPFLGTCGGCQHAVIEYARHVAGLVDADHEETNPQGENLVITRLACSLVDGREELALRPRSRLHAAVGAKSTERYRCNFGPGHRHAELYRDGALHVTAVNADGEPRAFELPGHPWFVATLFQPELHALDGRLHPIVAAFFAHVSSAAEPATRLAPNAG